MWYWCGFVLLARCEVVSYTFTRGSCNLISNDVILSYGPIVKFTLKYLQQSWVLVNQETIDSRVSMMKRNEMEATPTNLQIIRTSALQHTYFQVFSLVLWPRQC